MECGIRAGESPPGEVENSSPGCKHQQPRYDGEQPRLEGLFFPYRRDTTSTGNRRYVGQGLKIEGDITRGLKTFGRTLFQTMPHDTIERRRHSSIRLGQLW